jgi:poly(A) polymerase Pap1
VVGTVAASRLVSLHRRPREWPQPVVLKQIEDGPLQVQAWNPKVRNIIVLFR